MRLAGVKIADSSTLETDTFFFGRDFGETEPGLRVAPTGAMAPVNRYTELAAWQRAYELQLLCEELLRDKRVQRDFKYRNQLSDAASSGPRNIAEGFGRFRPRENAQFVRVANGSANEIRSLFFDARAKGYIAPHDFSRFEIAAKRAIGTIVRYLKYLDSCDPDQPNGPRPKSPRTPRGRRP